MSEPRKIEVEQTVNGFRIRNYTVAGTIPWLYVNAPDVKSIIGVHIENQALLNNTAYHWNEKLQFVVTFSHPNSDTVTYDIQDIQNQPTWTPDFTGLQQALSDINDWLIAASASGSTSIINVLTGNTETPSTVQNFTSGGPGNTLSDVKSFSIRFEGHNGLLSGVSMNSGDVMSKSASLGNTLSPENYLVPDTVDVDFPFSPRVVISYVI